MKTIRIQTLNFGVTLVFSLFLMTTGCATTVTVARQRPAEVNLKQIKTVAVAGVNGQRSADIENELTAQLVESQRYTVIERSRLENIIREQQLQMSELVDPTKASEIGRLSGAQALITIDSPECQAATGQRQEKWTCTKNDGKKSYETTCINYIKSVNANCRILFKIVEVETARILDTKNAVKSFKNEHTATDNEPAGFDTNGITLSLISNAVTEFVHRIAPYTEYVPVVLEDDGDAPELAVGNGFATQSDWASAIEQYTQAVNRLKQKGAKSTILAKAYYDLGVALGYSGQYDEGIDYLKQAYVLKQNDLYMSEMGKIKGFKADEEKLKQQLTAEPPPTTSAPVSEPTPTNVSSENIPQKNMFTEGVSLEPTTTKPTTAESTSVVSGQ